MPSISSNTIQLHIAAKLPDTNEYRFLVLQRSKEETLYPNMWQVVTGVIEQDETAVQAAKREMTEETGMDILKFWTLPYIASFFDPGKDEIQMVPVFGVLVNYRKEVTLSKEHQDYQWLTLDECVDKLSLPSHKEGTRILWEYILLKDFSLS